MPTDNLPIACTLNAGDYQMRMARIADLNARALISHRVEGLALVMQYRADALSDIEELARRETECCAFLTFDLRRSGDFVELAVVAPREAEIAAETLFNDFVSGAQNGCASGRACA